MRKFFSFLLCIVVVVLIWAPYSFALDHMETEGGAIIAFTDDEGNDYHAEDGYDTQSGEYHAAAAINFPNGGGAFAMTKVNGVNNVGAKAGVSINSAPFQSPYDSSEPPKTGAEGHSFGSVSATGTYYYSGGAPGFIDTIRMLFLYDGSLTPQIEGLDLTKMNEEFSVSVEYHIDVDVHSVGFWGYEVGGWQWGFSDSEILTLSYDEDEGGFFWQNKNGDRIDSVVGISKNKEMAVEVMGAVYLINAPFQVDCSLETSVDFSGLAFEEGGYANLRSDFFDTLEFSLVSDNISDQPFPDPVPIPGAVWLLGSGLAGLVGLRRRKFK